MNLRPMIVDLQDKVGGALKPNITGAGRKPPAAPSTGNNKQGSQKFDPTQQMMGRSKSYGSKDAAFANANRIMNQPGAPNRLKNQEVDTANDAKAFVRRLKLEKEQRQKLNSDMTQAKD